MSLTYPNEVWPAGTLIEDLDGTTDPATGLPYIAKGTGPASIPSYEVQYNRRLHRQNRVLAAWRQGMVVHEGGLNIGVYPIDFVMGGVRRSFLGATGVAVPDDSSLVVYLDNTLNLRMQTTWPTDITSYLPLAAVVTSNGQLSVTDQRLFAAFLVPTLDAANVRDRRMLTACRGSVGANQGGVEIFAWDPPGDVTMEEVQVYCSGVVAVAGVDVKVNGGSVLSAPATPSAGVIVKPVISAGSIPAGHKVTVHVTTNGSGSISDLAVTMLLKSPLAG